MKKNFTNWNKNELRTLLGLRQADTCNYLDDWISLRIEQVLSGFESTYFEWLFNHKVPYIDNWNEAELRDQFISNITSIIDYNSSKALIGVFAERSLSAVINEITISGKIDWMVAKGEDAPMQPFFFIHEYKQEDGNQAVSGRAQLYAIMRVAQELNDDPSLPIYGCYVLGRFWFFTTLVGNHYCITNAYNSTIWEGLLDIVKILKVQKELILQRVS